MENKRFFTILKNMLDSGDYKENVFEDILDELGIPDVCIAILDEVTLNEPLHPAMQLFYIESIRKGRLEPKMISAELLDIMAKALKYRYEFYRRSKDVDPLVENEFKQLTNSSYLEKKLELGCDDVIEVLPFEFDPVFPLEYNLGRLHEFQRNAEVVLRNYYKSTGPNFSAIPKSLLDFSVEVTSKMEGRGKHVEKELEVFRLWRRSLTAWDLVEERPEAGRSKEFWLKVGTTISKEFNVWNTFEATKLRQMAKSDYAKACAWIESAVAGCFPQSPKVEIGPEDFCNKYHAGSPELECEFCYEKFSS